MKSSVPSSTSIIPPPPLDSIEDGGDSSEEEDSDDEMQSPRGTSFPKTPSFIRSPSIISPPSVFSQMFTKGLTVTPEGASSPTSGGTRTKTPKSQEVKTPTSTTTPKGTKTPRKSDASKKDSPKKTDSSSKTPKAKTSSAGAGLLTVPTTPTSSSVSIPSSDSILPPPPTWEYVPGDTSRTLAPPSPIPRDGSIVPPPPSQFPRDVSYVPPPPRSESILPPPASLPPSDSILPPPPIPNSESVIPPPPSSSGSGGLPDISEEGGLLSSRTLMFTNQGRLSRGRLTLDDALDNSQYRRKFEGFLEKNLCQENLRFLRAVQDYKSHIGVGKERSNFAISIVKIHLEKESPELVNLDSKTRSELLKRVEAHDFGIDLFDHAYQVIYNMVDKDVFRRWLTSKEYRDMATQERNSDWSVTRDESKGAFFKKNVITWRFSYNGDPHKVKLKHSPVGGKRVIFVDRLKMLSEKTAGGSQHPFKLINGDLSCCVNITYGLHGVEYELELNGRKFLDAQLEL